MPTYTEVIKFEKAAPKGTIRLVRSGEFYRAYDHSAWLFCCCIAEYKVIRKYIKSLQSDIFYVGFPEKSLFNNIGERESAKTDYGFDIRIREEELPDEADYETWKENVVPEKSSNGDFYSLPLAGADAEREAIRLLREFPLESRTPVETTVFVAELRKLLSNK